MKKQLTEQISKYDATENKANEQQQLEEERHNEELHALERSIQQLKVLLPFDGNKVAIDLIIITGLLIL